MQWSPSRVLAARRAADLSQREVAEAAGVSIDTVKRAENGRHEPGANALGRIAQALGVKIDSLYIHEPEATEPATSRGNDSTPADAGTRLPAGV